jgi:putative heme iron utilization protein
MFIEDESNVKQIYARDRLTVEANAVLVDKSEAL